MEMNHQTFLELLQRYTVGLCSSEEKQVMDYWYNLLGKDTSELPAGMTRQQLEDLLWDKIYHRIRAGEDDEP
ncbi:hypothetical protein [Nibrella saemangeumensis]